MTAFDRRLARYNRCVLSFNPSANPAGCGKLCRLHQTLRIFAPIDSPAQAASLSPLCRLPQSRSLAFNCPPLHPASARRPT
jgi:hypothetical protein